MTAEEATVKRGSSGRIIRVGLVLFGIHSLLASRQCKDAARRLFGARYRNGLYRFVYNLQSAIMYGWAMIWFLRLPDQPLYHVKAPWSWLLRLGQVASLWMLWHSVRVTGFARFLGLSQVGALKQGTTPPPEPEAQGPPLERDGQLRIVGPFRYTRHPDNLPIIGVLWLFPNMTVNWLTLAILGSIYAIVGSLHEEQRLRQAYGQQYADYQQAVPFMLPQLKPAAPPPSSARPQGAG